MTKRELFKVVLCYEPHNEEPSKGPREETYFVGVFQTGGCEMATSAILVALDAALGDDEVYRSEKKFWLYSFSIEHIGPCFIEELPGHEEKKNDK